MQIVMVYFLGSYLRFFKKHLLVKTEKKFLLNIVTLKWKAINFVSELKANL